MIRGNKEGYVEIQSEKTIEFPSVESAKLFKDLCEGIDWYNALDQSQKNNIDPYNDLTVTSSYRYDYIPKLKRKNGKIIGCSITITDVGE